MERTLGGMMRRRQDGSDLVWFFSGESRGDMGERSNFGPMVNRIECGGRTGGRPIMGPDDRCLDAADREWPVLCALRELWRRAPDAYRVLRAAYSPTCRQPEHVTAAWGRPVAAEPAAALVPVAPMTSTAQRAWLGSGTDKGLDEWLVRLAWRAAMTDADPLDRARVAAIRRDAEALLTQAMAAYRGAKPRRAE
jgi:hypothetical protein